MRGNAANCVRSFLRGAEICEYADPSRLPAGRQPSPRAIRCPAYYAAHVSRIGRAYVEAVEQQIRGRQEMTIDEQGGSWVLKEEHGGLLGPEKRPMSSFWDALFGCKRCLASHLLRSDHGPTERDRGTQSRHL
jgi:hypothetical protein